MNLKYVCAQPAEDFFTWQVETLIVNFTSVGINPSDIHILLATQNGIIPDNWKKILNHYKDVGFFFYDDTREDRIYHPSIYFNLMKHHLTAFPELEHEALFLFDSDIALVRKIDFSSMLNDNIWYLSDTNSYIQYDYIQQKGDHVYQDMCRIIGIDPLIPKLMRSHSGGAQYLTKGTTKEFWHKVEVDSINLFNHFLKTEHLHVKKFETDYPIQRWTAGMWSLLWNAWLHGHETKVDPRLNFTWAGHLISSLNDHDIVHNAGVLASDWEKERLFYKANHYQKLPYNEQLDLDDTKVSYWYFNEVRKAGMQSPLVNNQTISPSLAGRLGNNLFMVANAYARAKDSGKDLVININEVDKTDDYTKSVFRNFTFVNDTSSSTKLSGYFQSELYFKEYASDIKKMFGPSDEFKTRIKSEMPWLFNKKVACINVRKGDYLNFPNIHPTLSAEYIEHAVHYLDKPDVYLVISDDMEWCKQNIKLANVCFLSGYNTFEQLWIMSMCSDFIISNSSFSWWGSYLSENKNKKVLAPSAWFAKDGPDSWYDIYYDECDIVPSFVEGGLIKPIGKANKISVLTLTYKRKELLEEAIMSFLSQEYAHAEMVIVNDDPNVTYTFNHPQVKIYNVSNRFGSIAEKFEYAYKLCQFDYIYRLDDDDLLAPNALRSVNRDINNNDGYDIYRANGLYFFSNNNFQKRCDNVNNGNVFTKDYLNKISFEPKSIGEDVDMVYNNGANIFVSQNENPTMIYRWGMNTYHASASENKDNKDVLSYVDEVASINGVTEGLIELSPKFLNNYYEQIYNRSLTDIANSISMDKGTTHPDAHGYTTTYEELFKDLVNKPINMLEIGVYDPRFPGASVKLWTSYFKNINLVGFDINPKAKELESDNVRIFIGDQGSGIAWGEFKSEINNKYDIIIDDGSHVTSDILTSFTELYFTLKDGGMYIIEDLNCETTSYKDVYEGILDYMGDEFKSKMVAYHNLKMLVIYM